MNSPASTASAGAGISSTSTSTSTSTNPDHIAIEPTILYFGTPVVLLSTENDGGSANLAPISSAWALGYTIVLGLGAEGQTAYNLARRPQIVINVPGTDYVEPAA